MTIIRGCVDGLNKRKETFSKKLLKIVKEHLKCGVDNANRYAYTLNAIRSNRKTWSRT